MVRSEKDKAERYFAITRELSKSGEFKNAMESCGWTVIFLKCIVISPKPHLELERIVSSIILNNYDACVFLSANTVDILMANADNTGNAFAMISKLRSIRTICVGPRTAKTLSQYGIESVIVPKSHNTQGLVKCLSSYKSQVHKIVIPRSQLGDNEIVLSLSRLGFFVDQYQLYDVSTNLIIDNQWKWFLYLLRDKNLDAVGFTSPSSVKALFQIVKNRASNEDQIYLRSHNALVSIGQKTSQELKKYASGRIVEAVEHNLNGMAEASRFV
jgi:uroporphyrinogen III methyltransferase/synthase